MSQTDSSQPMSDALRAFGQRWKQLFLTDVICKVIAFVLLTPLLALTLRGLLAVAGRTVLCDVDIAYFLLGPLGWLTLIVAGAFWVAIVALQQASLLGILVAATKSKHLGAIAALRFAFANAWAVLRVAARIVAWTLLAVAPFLALAAIIYATLLTQYDINYYLKERPPVFLVAVSLGAVILLAVLAILLCLVTKWFFALPLVLFEGAEGRDALRISSERSRSHRWVILGWLVGWVLASAVLSAIGTGMVALLGRLIIPSLADSLRLLAFGLGGVVLIGTLINLLVNLLSTTVFAALLCHLYLDRGRDPSAGKLPVSSDDMAPFDARIPITPKRLLAGGIIGVLIAALIGAVTLRSVQLDDDVLVMAHRGSSKAAPENTLAAIRRAIEDGADFVEIDVQETADGEVVVFHDSDFMKLAGVDLKIWDATTEQLQEIDIGGRFGKEFNEERVPTLAQVLELCKGKIGVNIELKYYGHDKQLEQRVAEIVDELGMENEVKAMSLKAEAVRKMKTLRPKWPVGQLLSVTVGDMKKIDGDFLAVNASFVDRALVERAHKNGKEVYAWTVNDAPSMSTLISRGVDGLLTDKPALARSVLQQRAAMSPAERLLLELAEPLGLAPKFTDQ